jgi:hypothetical protein
MRPGVAAAEEGPGVAMVGATPRRDAPRTAVNTEQDLEQRTTTQSVRVTTLSK